MKKIIVLLISTLLVSCAVHTVNQVELYGTVERVSYYRGHNHHQVWCEARQRYYDVISDKIFQPGTTIRIK